MSKFYIQDFCEDLNYQGIVLHVGESIHVSKLRDRLEKDNVGHMYRFLYMLETKNRLMYIENCDFQDVPDRALDDIGGNIFDRFDDCTSIFELHEDSSGFYILLPAFIAANITK